MKAKLDNLGENLESRIGDLSTWVDNKLEFYLIWNFNVNFKYNEN